jgi:hypothetical protein
MKIDENKDVVPETVPAGDRQNRREFFNGLGKWSMIVIAATSFLRGSATQSNAASEGTQRPEWQPAATAPQRLAKKKHHQHVDNTGGHYNTPHGDVAHVDTKIQLREGQQPSGQPPTKKMYE